MRYYELFRYADNSVGGEFVSCTENKLEALKKEFNPDKVYEITEDVYGKLQEKAHRKHLRMVTGYPKESK